MIKKNIDYVKAILSVLIFSYFDLLVLFIGKKFFNLTLIKTDFKMIVILDFVCTFLVMFLISFIYKRDLISEFKKVINSVKEHKFFKNLLEAFLISLLFKVICAMVAFIILEYLGIEAATSNNQEIINEMFNVSPALIVISACIFAPVEEELLFRLMPSKILKNKWVYIIVSGLIFGLRHVTSNLLLLFIIFIVGYMIDYIINHKDKKYFGVTILVLIIGASYGIFSYQYGNLLLVIKSFNINEVINSIIYIGMGIGFGYIYKKYNNIYINIGAHAINNIIGMLALFFK